jgi:hypothetical protein
LNHVCPVFPIFLQLWENDANDQLKNALACISCGNISCFIRLARLAVEVCNSELKSAQDVLP